MSQLIVENNLSEHPQQSIYAFKLHSALCSAVMPVSWANGGEANKKSTAKSLRNALGKNSMNKKSGIKG